MPPRPVSRRSTSRRPIVRPSSSACFESPPLFESTVALGAPWMSGAAPIPRLTAVTLGVRDFHVSLRFYEALGFARRLRSSGDEVAFFDAGGVVLALYRWDQLAQDAALEPIPFPAGFRGTTLAWNLGSRAEVDAAFVRALRAGAGLLKA